MGASVMSEGEGNPVRRLRSVRPEVRDETAESILPGSPRVGALDALLREVDGLRLTLETDLSLAAAAVEAGAGGIAVDIIDSDRDGLRAFETRALEHLSDLADEPTARGRRWWTRVPVAPFVAAAAIVGFLVGVVPGNVAAGPGEAPTSTVSAQYSLEQLTSFAAQGRTSQVRVASVALHNQIAALLDQAKNDPAAAQQALLLLSYERDAILQSGDSAELGDVLAQGAALAARIRNAMPPNVRSSVPVVPVIAATAAASPAPKPTSPSTKPTAKPVSSPAPRPGSTPKPSASPSVDPGIVPTDAATVP